MNETRYTDHAKKKGSVPLENNQFSECSSIWMEKEENNL